MASTSFYTSSSRSAATDTLRSKLVTLHAERPVDIADVDAYEEWGQKFARILVRLLLRVADPILNNTKTGPSGKSPGLRVRSTDRRDGGRRQSDFGANHVGLLA